MIVGHDHQYQAGQMIVGQENCSLRDASFSHFPDSLAECNVKNNLCCFNWFMQTLI